MKKFSRFVLGATLLIAPAAFLGCGEESKPAPEAAPAGGAPKAAAGAPAPAPEATKPAAK